MWLLAPVAVVTWMGFMHPLRRLDFWWHLKAGEVIFTSLAIPRVDLFSFTRAGQAFLYQNWLGEVVYYLVYRAGRFPLLILFNTALLLLAFMAVFHLCLQATSRRRSAVLPGLVAALALGLYSNVRPQSYSFVLFALFYWIVWTYRDGGRDRLWALPPLMLLWVNLHGAFVLGIQMMGIVLVAEAVRRLFRGPQQGTMPPARLGRLAIILVLTAAATLVNPETYRVFAYVRQLQLDPSSQLFVTEWQVPDVKDMSHILIFFGPFFVVLLVLLYSRRRLNLTELGLFATFTVLALAATRSAIWFSLIVAPILARHLVDLDLSDLASELRRRPFPSRLPQMPAPRPGRPRSNRNRLNWAIAALLALFTITLSPWVRPHLGSASLKAPLIEKGTPVGAMDYIAAHSLTGNIFHTQGYGDYLIWRLWPQQRSFIDGRVHLYDGAFVRDYILIFHDENWQSRIAKYDISYLLLPKDDERAALMVEGARTSDRWTLLYEDENSVLFEKASE